MKREKAEALIVVRGKDELTKLAQSISKEMDKAARSAGKVGDANKKTSKSMLTAGERAALFATGLQASIAIAKQVGAAVQAIAVHVREGAIATETFARFNKQMADEVGGAERAHERLVEAARSGIDNTSIEKFALSAKRAGLDVEQTARLLDLAGKLSIETGKSVKDSAEDMFKAVSAGRVRTLQSLGVNIDLTKALKDQADAWGVSTASLDQGTKVQIRYNDVVKAAGEALDNIDTDTAIQEVNELETAWDNLVSTMQEGAAAAFVATTSSIDYFMEAISGFDGDEVVAQFDRMADIRRRLRQAKQIQDDLAAKGSTVAEEINRQVAQAMTMLANDQWVEANRTWAARILTDLERSGRLIKIQGEAAQQLAAELGIQTKAEKQSTEVVEGASKARENHLRLLKETVEALDVKRHATVASLSTQAAMADQMGKTGLATELWAKALKATETAHIDLTSRVDLLYSAARRQNNEFIKAIQIQAEMARALGNTAEAGALEAQLAGLLTGDTGNRKRKPRRGGGKAKPEEDHGEDLATTLARERLRIKQETVTHMEKIRERDRKLAEEDRQRELEDHGAFLAMLEERERAVDRLMEAQARLARGSLSAAASFASSFDGAAANVANASSIIVDQMTQVKATVKAFEDAGMDAASGYKAAVPGMIAAGGQLVAGFASDQQSKATILAVMEGAAAIASFATQDYWGGAMHTAAAIQYGLIAGGVIGQAKGGGGGGGRSKSLGAPNLGNVGPPRPEGEKSGQTIVVNLDGATIIGANRKQAGRDLAKLIKGEMQSRSGNSPGFNPV